MNTTFIYTLSDPVTYQVRYVGKSNNPLSRYRSHYYKCENESQHKRNWINSIKKSGLKPILDIVDEIPISEWKFWETYWIQQFKVWGFKLTNSTLGGDGLTKGNQTSFQKNSIPWNKNKSGYTSSKAQAVLQYTKDGEFIKEFRTCKDAAIEFGCIEENIRRACVGKSKSAKGFKWKYKNMIKL